MEAFDILPLNIITGGWLQVNFFVRVEFTIEICAVEVKGVDVPVVTSGNGEDVSETGEACNWGKGVEIVDAKFLCEASGNEAGLILFYGPVGLPFDAENPFASDDVFAGRSLNICPGFGFVEGSNFAIHRLLPFWPVGARSCLIECFRIVLYFRYGCFKEVFTFGEVGEVARSGVVGVCASVIIMGMIGVHPAAHGSGRWCVIFFTCGSFSLLDSSLFC